MSDKCKADPRNAVIARIDAAHEKMFEVVASSAGNVASAGTQACLDATFGRGSSLNSLLGSNSIERAYFARRLGIKACELAHSSGLEMTMLQSIDRSWIFDRHASVFDLPSVRRINNQLKKLAASSISVIQLGCLPSPRGSFEYCPVVRSAVFSQNSASGLSADIAKLRRKLECPLSVAGGAVELRPIRVQSRRWWFTEVARLFDMRDPLTDRCRDEDGLGAQPEWNKGKHARTRERFEVLTMCTLDRLVMATGEVAPVLDGLLREAASRARKLYASGGKPLHRDQIPHFWFEQHLHRKDFSVPPFVKLR